MVAKCPPHMETLWKNHWRESSLALLSGHHDMWSSKARGSGSGTTCSSCSRQASSNCSMARGRRRSHQPVIEETIEKRGKEVKERKEGEEGRGCG